MTRTTIFTLALGAALAFPTVASATCGTMQGSFFKSCEQGVQVYRHNALSGVPAPLSAAEASLEGEKIRAKTARVAIASQDRANARNADLRNRELSLEDYRSRIYNRTTRRNSYYGSGYGSYGAFGTYGARGYNFGTPTTRIRKGSLNIKH